MAKQKIAILGGKGMLGSVAKDAGVWILHISTDLVFDGKSERPYVETNTPNPIKTYGNWPQQHQNRGK